MGDLQEKQPGKADVRAPKKEKSLMAKIMEKAMHIYVAGSVVLLLVNFYFLYDFTVQAKKNAPPDYKEFTDMRSLWKTAVATAVFVFLERFINAVAPAYLAPYCKI